MKWFYGKHDWNNDIIPVIFIDLEGKPYFNSPKGMKIEDVIEKCKKTIKGLKKDLRRDDRNYHDIDFYVKLMSETLQIQETDLYLYCE